MRRIHGDNEAQRTITIDELVDAYLHTERARQDDIWGGWDHDAQHSHEDWVRLLMEHLDKLVDAVQHESEWRVSRRTKELAAVSYAYLEQTVAVGLQVRGPIERADPTPRKE